MGSAVQGRCCAERDRRSESQHQFSRGVPGSSWIGLTRTRTRNGKAVASRPSKNGKRPREARTHGFIPGDRMNAPAPQMDIEAIQRTSGSRLAVTQKIEVHTAFWIWLGTFRNGRARLTRREIQWFVEETSVIPAPKSPGV